MGGGYFLSRYGWGVKGGVLPYRFWGFCLSFCVLFSHILCSFFGLTRKLEFLCFFVFPLFSLSLVCLIRCYWCIETVASVV